MWVGEMGRRRGPRWNGCCPDGQAAWNTRICSRATEVTVPPGHESAASITQANSLVAPAWFLTQNCTAPLGLQLPRRRITAGRTGRGSCASRARGDLPSPITTGFYGVVRFAEAAREWGMRTVFGAELSLDSVPRTGTADPGGTHLLVLARGQEGYRRLSREIAAAHLAGGEKGKTAVQTTTC